MSRIILIRGAPGVGKSTLARRLRQHYPQGVTIEVDHVRGMINGVQWVNTEEHFHALNATLKVALAYIKIYEPVVVIDTFSPSKLTFFSSQLSSDGQKFPYLIISLYCEEETLKRRIIARESGYKEIENCLLLNKEVGNNRHEKEIVIDTTVLGPDEVLDVVLESLP